MPVLFGALISAWSSPVPTDENVGHRTPDTHRIRETRKFALFVTAVLSIIISEIATAKSQPRLAFAFMVIAIVLAIIGFGLVWRGGAK